MSVSILIPTFNRKRFSDIISLNIKNQTYPLIKEILIADDGDDDERLELKINYSVMYYKTSRVSIGEKRNFLKSRATGDYLVHFDTDDFYHHNYISNSVFNLIKSGKQISGSADMLMLHCSTNKTYRQRCINLDMLNEATLVYTKKYADTHNFSPKNSSEGISFCDIADIYETPIDTIMICLSHENNTVSKTAWVNKKYEEILDISHYAEHIKILSAVNI